MQNDFSKTLDFFWLSGGYCEQSQKMVNPALRHKSIHFPNYFGVIRHPTAGIILFDTGYTEDFYTATKHFPEKLYARVTPTFCRHENGLLQLEKRGIQPSEVSYVVISHFHADHICGLRHFSKAKFIYSKRSYEHLIQLKKIIQIKNAFLSEMIPVDFLNRSMPIEDSKVLDLPTTLRPFTKGFDLIGDGSILGVPLGGHTQGHMGLALRTQAGEALLIGDAAWKSESYRKLIMPHFMVRLLISDWGQYWKTLVEINAVYNNNRSLYILPSHCSENHQTFI